MNVWINFEITVSSSLFSFLSDIRVLAAATLHDVRPRETVESLLSMGY